MKEVERGIWFILVLLGFSYAIMTDADNSRLRSTIEDQKVINQELGTILCECDSVYHVQKEWIERLEKNRSWHQKKYKRICFEKKARKGKRQATSCRLHGGNEGLPR